MLRDANDPPSGVADEPITPADTWRDNVAAQSAKPGVRRGVGRRIARCDRSGAGALDG